MHFWNSSVTSLWLGTVPMAAMTVLKSSPRVANRIVSSPFFTDTPKWS